MCILFSDTLPCLSRRRSSQLHESNIHCWCRSKTSVLYFCAFLSSFSSFDSIHWSFFFTTSKIFSCDILFFILFAKVEILDTKICSVHESSEIWTLTTSSMEWEKRTRMKFLRLFFLHHRRRVCPSSQSEYVDNFAYPQNDGRIICISSALFSHLLAALSVSCRPSHRRRTNSTHRIRKEGKTTHITINFHPFHSLTIFNMCVVKWCVLDLVGGWASASETKKRGIWKCYVVDFPIQPYIYETKEKNFRWVELDVKIQCPLAISR